MFGRCEQWQPSTKEFVGCMVGIFMATMIFAAGVFVGFSAMYGHYEDKYKSFWYNAKARGYAVEANTSLGEAFIWKDVVKDGTKNSDNR